ncbi:pre-B-cell leukemia transcription factor-interacting protein 1-like isoform 2-T2 [Rhinophrynus dorsalis]
MSEVQEGRDSDNNWVIAGSTEGLPVESLGAAHTEAPHVQEEQKDQSAAPGPDRCQDAPETNGSSAPKDTKEGEIPPSPTAATVAHQEEVDMPPEELSTTSQEPGEPLTKPVLGLPRTVGEELEEVSCSSSEDDVEGLRKRVVRGAAPVTVGPSPRESSEQETDGGFGLTLNKCIIIALALVGIGFLAFSGIGFGTEEDSPQTVVQRSVDGDDKQPQVIEDIQAWIQQHAAEFAGDPGSLQVISGLLDKVAKENQEIRHMQATLQAQKEELETLLKTGEGQKVTPSPQHQDLMEENVRLKDALLKEETAHLSATEELQGLRDKMEVLDRSVLEKEGLVSENAKLKEDLESSRVQIEGFLAQKETLVAESQMLRQELDKQRSLVTSIRRDLENLTTQTDNLEVVSEQQLQSKITDLSNRLAMEFQRSETWEKKYVEHARKRKEQTKEEWRDHGHKEWKKGDKSARTPNISSTSGDFHKHSADFKHGKEHAKKWKEESPKESQHEEWKTKKHDHREDKREKHWEDKREKHSEDKKHRHWEGEHRGKEHQHDSAHQHENKERSWKEKHHHEGERDGGFHPRKDQKEFSKTIKEEENTQRKHQGEKAHSKDSQHRHHDHNKFWKKLSDHQYRIPVGCAGLEDCARKDGIDLFNVELKPVQRKQFENVLQSYLTKVGLSKHLPQLIPLLDGFFDGPVFSHQKIRFRDFVDDVEDFLEDLAKKETGNDDIVDDFEKYVYTNFFGEAATNKKRTQ